MPSAYCLYVDDSGTRQPDRRAAAPRNGPLSSPWFALGGLLIEENAIDAAEELVRDFRGRWLEIGNAPLRSYNIRNMKDGFRWLTQNPARKAQFLGELSSLIATLPIHVVACVVDRDGYDHRYLEAYGPRRWKVCRSAFTILVERSAKFAQHQGAKLRVYVEKSDPKTDKQMRDYYDELRANGAPFDQGRSAKYNPMAASDLSATLYEFRLKDKTSALMQIADLVLWPVCKNGYVLDDRAYEVLRARGKLLESHCTSTNGLQGTKYYCFEKVARIEEQKNKSPRLRALESATIDSGDLVG